MAIPGSVSKSRWIAGAALVVLVIAAGAGWLLFGTSAKPPQAAAAQPPAPAVGVRLAAMKGVSQSFEFVGRIKAIEKVDLRARVEGFLDKVLFREGQDVKAGELLYQIEKVQFQAAGRPGQGQSRRGRGDVDQRQGRVRAQPRAGRSATSPRRARSTRTRPRSTAPRAG